MHRVHPCPAPCLLAIAAILAFTGCTTPGGPTPSLAPRAAEALDPRAPVVAATTAQTAEPALAARLAELVARAHQGDAGFTVAAAEAQRLAAGAGAPQTESWIVAQQALSVAVAAREPAAQALGDIDALTQAQLSRNGGIGPADLAAIEAAAADVAAIERRQAQTIDTLQARLGG